jgi:hypothetical protein
MPYKKKGAKSASIGRKTKDSARGKRAIQQGGGRTGEAYVGTGKSTSGVTAADLKRGKRAIQQGGGRTGEAYVGTGKPARKPARKPTPKPASKAPAKPAAKPKGSPMEQWARLNPTLAAKVKPGQSGYNTIQKVLREMKAKKSNVNKGKTA